MAALVHKALYSSLSKLTSELTPKIDVIKQSGLVIKVMLNIDDPTSQIDELVAKVTTTGQLHFIRTTEFFSLEEFSTLCMREALTRFVKHKAVIYDPEYFTDDDPRLHSFLSKLSYAGIEMISKNTDDFLHQFKANNITMKIPISKKSDKARGSKNFIDKRTQVVNPKAVAYNSTTQKH